MIIREKLWFYSKKQLTDTICCAIINIVKETKSDVRSLGGLTESENFAIAGNGHYETNCS